MKEERLVEVEYRQGALSHGRKRTSRSQESETNINTKNMQGQLQHQRTDAMDVDVI